VHERLECATEAMPQKHDSKAADRSSRLQSSVTCYPSAAVNTDRTRNTAGLVKYSDIDVLIAWRRGIRSLSAPCGWSCWPDAALSAILDVNEWVTPAYG